MDEQIAKKYGDQIDVIAIDANGDKLEGVQDFVNQLTVNYPVGLEDTTTPTYKALVEQNKGANPFPVDVVVDRYGIITYVAREYDPEGIIAAIDAALAE